MSRKEWRCFVRRWQRRIRSSNKTSQRKSRMQVMKDETLAIRASTDVVLVRQQVRTRATEQGFSIVDQTKIVTAASALARNTLGHGRGGHCRLQTVLDDTGRKGVRLIFEDTGPGIPDLSLALK